MSSIKKGLIGLVIAVLVILGVTFSFGPEEIEKWTGLDVTSSGYTLYKEAPDSE